MAPPRTTRRSAQNVEFQELPETSRRAARPTVPFTEEKKAIARKYILRILMKEETYVEPDVFKQTLKQDPEWQELVKGVNPSTITKFVNEILTDVQTRPVEVKSMFPAATVRMNVYKNSEYKDIKKFLNTKKLSKSEKEEVGLALNDPESTLFKSVLDMVDNLKTEAELKELIDIIDNPKFDINTNKNGESIFFYALFTNRNNVFREKLSLYILNNKNPDLTMQVTATIRVNNYNLKITCTHLVFALVLMVYYPSLNLYTIIDKMATIKKLPDLYITPQKTYGTITTQDGTVIPINNIWLLKYFYHKAAFLINTLKLDLKNGEGNRTVKETVVAKVRQHESQRELLENEILALEAQLTGKNNELSIAINNLRQMRYIELSLNRLNIQE